MAQPDVIGIIYNNDGEWDEEGNVITAPTKQTGYHVNFPEEIPEIAQYKVDPQPTTPMRIYAGGNRIELYLDASKRI